MDGMKSIREIMVNQAIIPIRPHAKREKPGSSWSIGTTQPQTLAYECTQGEKGIVEGQEYVRAGCGYIEPRCIALGRFIRRRCACEIAQYEKIQKEKDRIEQRQALMTYTYNALGKHWGIDAMLAMTFATFRQEIQPDAYEDVLDFAKTLTGNLILYGEFGLGKTHLLAALCNLLAAQGKKCCFLNASMLFAEIDRCRMVSEPYDHIIESAIKAYLFALDDVDKTQPTQARQDILYLILDARAGLKKPTALTINDIEKLAHYLGDHNISRLSRGMVQIGMTGTDYRTQQI